ncbi:MAG: HAMP domain-containing histidine kinase, partial [Campylobacteraceae bacterium]|nr:HAMP domain-containing histidine kinase [Campylobacteraceae bacterium]
GIIELRKKDKQLQHQERVCQNVEIINMLAHQWRQPLSDIVMNINNMILDIELDDIKKDIFKDTSRLILDKSQILSDQIDAFLNHYKPNEKKTDVTLAVLMKNILTIVDYRISKNSLTIKADYDGAFMLHTYESEVEQIIVHLINNSIDAYEKNNQINESLSLLFDSSKERLVISIIDKAGGISENIIDEIFDPYFSTKEEKNGAGLGLYMSRLLVEKHLNGHLDIFNKDEGCIAKLTIDLEDYSHA